jgi:hypothetical protein
MHFLRSLVVAVVVMVGRSGEAAPAPIVVESSDGESPPEWQTLLWPVHAELARRGFQTRAALAATIERSISRAPRRLTAAQVLEAQGLVARSYDALVEGEYARAIASADGALSLYSAASTQLSREGALRDLHYRAMVVKARSQEALGRTEDAFYTASEVLRTFPDREVSPTEFDPRVGALFRRVRAELKARPTGALVVSVDRIGAVIFVNERFVGTGTASLDSLAEGTYRVHVRNENTDGRSHDVEVKSGVTARLDVAWELDGALQTSADRVVLTHPSGWPVERDLSLVMQLAGQLGASSAVVFGVRTIKGRRSLIGVAETMLSRRQTFAAVELEPLEPSPATLTNFAAFLAGDTSVDTSLIMTQRELALPVTATTPESTVSATSPSRFHDRWGWSSVGGGAVLFAVAGGFWLSADAQRERANGEDRQAERQRLRDGAERRELAALAIGAAGVAAVGIGTVRFLMARPKRRRGMPTQSFIAPTASGPVVGIEGWF